MHPTFCSLQSGWNLVVWCLTFRVHPTFCSLIFRVHPTFWSLKFVVHPIFCSIQDAPCIQFYNIESAPLICPNIQGASSIEHTIYGHVLGHKGVHVHPVHPGWIRPWGGGRTTAGVGPLFEWGGRGGNADCEPVSLACVLCRVVGHIVTLELDRRLNENGILCGFQNGFRERRSCETQLIQLVDDLGGRLAKGHRVGLV